MRQLFNVLGQSSAIHYHATYDSHIRGYGPKTVVVEVLGFSVVAGAVDDDRQATFSGQSHC